MPLTGQEELYGLVSKIPFGRVTSYGALGRSITHAVSGLVAGNWMNHCPEEAPWWRVIGAGGDLLLARKNPMAAQVQRARLEEEGIVFEGDQVRIKDFFWDPAE